MMNLLTKYSRGAKKLKVISKWGTGINSIDLDYAKKNNINVCTTPSAFS